MSLAFVPLAFVLLAFVSLAFISWSLEDAQQVKWSICCQCHTCSPQTRGADDCPQLWVTLLWSSPIGQVGETLFIDWQSRTSFCFMFLSSREELHPVGECISNSKWALKAKCTINEKMAVWCWSKQLARAAIQDCKEWVHNDGDLPDTESSHSEESITHMVDWLCKEGVQGLPFCVTCRGVSNT